MEDSTLEYMILLISVAFGLFALIKEMLHKPEIKYTGFGKNRTAIKRKRNWLYPIIMILAFLFLVYFGNQLRINHFNEKQQASLDRLTDSNKMVGLEKKITSISDRDSLILNAIVDTLYHHGYYLNQHLQLISIKKNTQSPVLNIHDNINSTFHDFNFYNK